MRILFVVFSFSMRRVRVILIAIVLRLFHVSIVKMIHRKTELGSRDMYFFNSNKNCWFELGFINIKLRTTETIAKDNNVFHVF